MGGPNKVGGGVQPREIQFDVNQRQIELRPGTGKSLDQEYINQYENLELNLFAASGRNFAQTGRDLVNVAADVINALPVGVPESVVGVIVGVFGNFDDVAWTAWHGAATIGDKIDLADKKFIEQLDKEGITGDKRKEATARWETFKAHAAEIIDGKEWGIAADGLQRVGKGVTFSLLDTGSALKNFVDGVAEGGAGLVVGGVKGFGYLLGKGVGYILEYGGAALEWAAGKVSAAGNQLEERSNRIYSSSPEAMAIEQRAKF